MADDFAALTVGPGPSRRMRRTRERHLVSGGVTRYRRAGFERPPGINRHNVDEDVSATSSIANRLPVNQEVDAFEACATQVRSRSWSKARTGGISQRRFPAPWTPAPIRGA